MAIDLNKSIEHFKARAKKPKFDETIDLEVQLRLKQSQLKESFKGSIDLPNQFGATKKIIVFCDESEVQKALKAGAVAAGLDDLKEQVMNGSVDFDIVLATPSVMPKIVQLGKVLGPKGLMPSPKNDTIVTKVEAGVESFMGGKINYSMTQGQGTIKLGVAKLSMDTDKIVENVTKATNIIASESKKFGGNVVKKVLLKPTMGETLEIDFKDLV